MMILNIEHFMVPAVHPTTDKTICSYKKLSSSEATYDSLTIEFGKEEYVNLAQGDVKTNTTSTY